MPDPLPGPRRGVWKWVLVIGLVVAAATSGAVALDRLRVAVNEVGPAGPQPDNTALMAALATRGEMPGLELHPDLARRVGKMWPAGVAAPDFTLPAGGGSEPVSLTGFRGRPVVVAFGSLTCDIFLRHAPEVDRLSRAYADRAAFLFVCVKEAGHQLPGLGFLIDPPDPGLTPLEGRRARLRRGMQATGLGLPSAIDLDGTAERAYDAFPLRLVVVGAEGRVALDLGKGLLMGWNLTVVENWLVAHPGSRPDRPTDAD